MKHVLVTGGAGFIGSSIACKLLETGYEVTAIDNMDDYYSFKQKEDNVRRIQEYEGCTFIRQDIREKGKTRKIIEEAGINTVIHEAAQAGVRASNNKPLKTLEDNCLGTLQLLEETKDTSIEKIVYASSSSVYGRIEYLPFDEEHPKNPISPYGASKVIAESLIDLHTQNTGIEQAILRYFTVYGPRIRPDLAIRIFTEKALKDEEIVIFGDGSKTRDFTYIDDAVDATIKALEKGVGRYNIGGGSRISIKELAEKIIKATSSRSTIKYTEPVEGDVEHTLSDTRKARRELGWAPRTGIDEGLGKTIEWVKNKR
ncbi:GDP-mannose 4,6-dehydratase [Candidatus Altiarchaeota archaeon]